MMAVNLSPSISFKKFKMLFPSKFCILLNLFVSFENTKKSIEHDFMKNFLNMMRLRIYKFSSSCIQILLGTNIKKNLI